MYYTLSVQGRLFLLEPKKHLANINLTFDCFVKLITDRPIFYRQTKRN